MAARPGQSRPAAFHPRGFCAAQRRDEPSAFGISIDRRNPDRVYVGTNCGLAISNDAGATWTFVDPTPNDPATNVWDVVAHHGQIVDICGDDGHFVRSTPAPPGRRAVDCRPALLDRGLSPRARRGVCGRRRRTRGKPTTAAVQLDSARHARFTSPGTHPLRRDEPPHGRRAAAQVRRSISGMAMCGCIAPAAKQPAGGGLRCPMATTGAVLPPTPPAGWDGPFTRSAGGHDDVGDYRFRARGNENACPVLFSSDGGVYFNTMETSPDCHRPILAATQCHAACALAVGAGRRRSTRHARRRPLFRQSG